MIDWFCSYVVYLHSIRSRGFFVCLSFVVCMKPSGLKVKRSGHKVHRGAVGIEDRVFREVVTCVDNTVGQW